MKLNIGAGGNQKCGDDGWLNLDVRSLDGIDLVIDLEKESLPYPENSVEEVNMQDFLEHLSKHRQEPFLRDLYRVMKPGAKVYIQIPDLGVAAKRYCGCLENPSPLQHRLDGTQMASVLYGGQDYESNYHKWGYDTQSLVTILERVGFAVRYISSDGGCNLLCWAAKPYTKVLIPVGGGIGDILQTYLANPSSRRPYEEGKLPIGEFPTSNVDASLWFGRLKAFKTVYPHVRIKVAISSTNSFSREIFDLNPYIDVVEILDEVPRSWFHYIDSEGFMHIEGSEFMYESLQPEPAEFYMSTDERAMCDSARNLGKYIVIHPYAGASGRVVITEAYCKKLVDRLIDELGYYVIVVGRESVFDGTITLPENFRYRRTGLTSLVNMISINASARLVLGAAAFIGMHSCMTLCAWYANIPTICLVPPKHDGGQSWDEFFADETNPTTWGARQPFNRTTVFSEKDGVSVDTIISCLTSLGVARL